MISASGDMDISPRALEAVLWDFDGTLINTEPMWFAAETEYMRGRGAPWPAEEARSYAGAAWTTSGGAMRDRLVEYGADPSLTAREVYDDVTDAVVEHLRSEGAPMPGVLELLDRTRAAGVPNAIVSASQARLIDAGLAVIGAAGMFEAIVTGPMVARGKPDPDGYLLATRMLDVRPHHCVVLEDSPTGCASGQRAGAQVVGVPSVVPLPQTPGQLRRVSLAGLTIDELERAVRAHLAAPVPDDAGAGN
ncbi:HAD family phosphatase [uncultured Propionibacterium sp.]|uniref:HAD family hydrolase n=1 Tax=uncultured Propionibacterium sp. TaxID=218066 RepID=UPI00292FEB1A|nr:HAD family phosphatase [uncultured Propionibacterium sp.]